MSDQPRTTSPETLQAWLYARPSVDAVRIAHRTAMRVAPVVIAAMAEDWAQRRHLTPLPVLRLNLTAGVACASPAPALAAAARAAVEGNYADTSYFSAAAIAASSTAAYAAQAVGVAPDARASSGRAAYAAASAYLAAAAASSHSVASLAFWPAVQLDAHVSVQERDPLASPLWHDRNPVAEHWSASIAILHATPGGDFWIDWYQRALDGRPQNLALLRDVALIEDAVWKQGGEALDAAIRDLRRRHALAATANGERIEPNPETGRLRLVPDSHLPDAIPAHLRRKIISATEIFQDCDAQAYGGLAADLAMLRRAVEAAGNLPLDLLDACISAARRLAIRIDTGDCPTAEQDPLIADYRARLRETAADILGSDPTAQELLARRAAISGDGSLIAARDEILETVATLAPVLEGRLAEALPRDAETATDPDAPPQDRAEASFRLAGRLLRIVAVRPIAEQVWRAFGAFNARLIDAVAYLQSIEYIATSPVVQAILRFLGL